LSLIKRTTAQEDHQADVLREYQRAVRVDTQATTLLSEARHVERQAKRSLSDATAALRADRR
jgi:hypothetical protein